MLKMGRGGVSPSHISTKEIWAALAEVPDPEMPIVNLVELGIVRNVAWNGDELDVIITPTFAACPAYEVMGSQIAEKVRGLGISKVNVVVRHDPPWTSEWITEEARRKMKAVGLAPPPNHQGDFVRILLDPVACPRCGSTDTSLRNSFGTTPCRMIYTCNNCKEPFEQFKPL
ncbi:MAG: 1,2-phenylacetyl-CoA epoxidase subunit PaaD [Anaerolineales bacterium]